MSYPNEAHQSTAARPGIVRVAMVCAALFILAPYLRAQETSQGAQTTGSAAQATVSNPGTPQPALTVPDTHPLAGAFLYTLGSIPERHNYLQSGFSIGEMGVTNAGYIPGARQSFTTATVPEATFQLISRSRRNAFSAGYLGGGYIYNNNPGLSSSFHSAYASDQIAFRRVKLGITDFFSYLPESPFGFGSFGGLGGLGAFQGGLAGINPTFMPNQSILTSQVGTYNNTALVELQYAASARTSVTAVGSYGILHATRKLSGFFSGDMVGGSASVSHSLTPRDSVGVSYQYNTFRYSGFSDTFDSNSINFDYGRKITGRLALQLSAGPELIRNRVAGINHTETVAAGFGDLTYARSRDRFSVSGGRFASTGSGIFQGADTAEVDGGWTRQITRRVSSSLTSGVARNSALVGAVNSFHYTYWFGGLSLNWALSRYVGFYVNYEYQQQLTNAGPCTTTVCAGALARQIVGVGFTFTPRPFGL